jgi:hypothetical protein
VETLGLLTRLIELDFLWDIVALLSVKSKGEMHLIEELLDHPSGVEDEVEVVDKVRVFLN